MIFIIMGPPGAGKGTQSERLAAELGLVKISTGDLFRSHVSRKTRIGVMVEAILKQGQLVPDDILMEMVAEEIRRVGCSKDVILDGCPRTVYQAESLEELGKAEDIFSIRSVIQIDVRDDEIRSRILGRLTCTQCGSVFHLTSKPPKKGLVCDACGATLISRSDDSESKIETRLRIYRKETAPVLDYYKSKGLLVSVDGNRGMGVVYDEMRKFFSRELA